MDSKLENLLKEGMAKLGHVIELAIGQAKKAKVSVAPIHGVEPILALESQFSISKIKDMISFSSDVALKPLVPKLIDKSTMEMCEGEMSLSLIMKEKGASIVIHADIGGAAGAYPAESKTPGIHGIRASVKNIPFEDGFFDFVIANVATPLQGDIVRTVKEVGRMVTLGGHAVIVDFHPFGRFAKKGRVRLRPMESVVKGIEDYYKICKVAGFSVNYIKETFIDENMRALFVTQEEKAAFRLVKDTPFLIFLVVNKKGKMGG